MRRWHGYGFLPGYRSPERIEWERARNRGPVYWSGVLSRTLDRRWVRPVLDTDPDWERLELRSMNCAQVPVVQDAALRAASSHD